MMNSDKTSNSLAINKEEMKYCADLALKAIIDFFSKRNIEIDQSPDVPPSMLPFGKSHSINYLIDYLNKEIFSRMLDLGNPRFQSFVPSCNNYIAVIGYLLATAYNPHCSSRLLSKGPLAIEEQVISWINERIGFSRDAWGLFVSGGSMANLTAMVLARRRKALKSEVDDISNYTAYISSETHESVLQACSIIGFPSENVKLIPATENAKIWKSHLLENLMKDISLGKIPFFAVCCAGSTNTGIIEPFGEIAKICQSYDIWLHVDAAYGGAYALHNELKHYLPGIHLATSIAIDPHKTMFQPYGQGVLLINNKNIIVTKNGSDYLHAMQKGEGLEPGLLGIELTRPFRALSLWMTLQYYGEEKFLDTIARSISMIDHMHNSLLEIDNVLITSYSPLGVITFCFEDKSKNLDMKDFITREICDKINATHLVFWCTTKVDGRVAIRIHINNPELNKIHVDQIVAELRNIVRDCQR